MSNTKFGFKSLTDVQCNEIYQRAVHQQVSRRVLADEYGVSDRTIGRVITAVRELDLDPTQGTSVNVAPSTGVDAVDAASVEPTDTTQTVTVPAKTTAASKLLQSIDSADESEFYANTNGLTLNITFRGEVKTVARSEPNYDNVMAAIINQGKKAAFRILCDKAFAITAMFGDNPNVAYNNGKVTFHGIELDFDTVNAAINRFAGEGDEASVRRLLNFIEKLAQNPSKSAISGLYRFIVHNNIEIDAEGNLIAFKKVRADMKDVHSGKFDNSVGNIIKMDRREVVEDPNQTCSAGLHACSWAYLGDSGFGSSNGAYVKVQINPRDVVSVPSDYNGTKMRCCEYKVIERIG